LTKTIKAKLETSTFLRPVRIFPKLPEERSALLFIAKAGRGTLILNCLGKGKERLRVGRKRVFPGSTHEGLLVTTAVQVNPAQGQYWSTGSKR
jgi:hypothetical protein